MWGGLKTLKRDKLSLILEKPYTHIHTHKYINIYTYRYVYILYDKYIWHIYTCVYVCIYTLPIHSDKHVCVVTPTIEVLSFYKCLNLSFFNLILGQVGSLTDKLTLILYKTVPPPKTSGTDYFWNGVSWKTGGLEGVVVEGM